MNLPLPDADAQAHSEQLCAHLRAMISAQGWISFAEYMQHALYTPGLGYYSGGAHKFGPDGDFITAPELTPLFGQTLAQQIAEIMHQSAPQVLEAGAGTGLLAADLLQELDRLGCCPERYEILEVSGELRQRQQETLRARVPALLERVTWLEQLPEHYAGAIVANELLDVMPVHLLAWDQQGVSERGVALDAAQDFCWEDRPLAARLAQAAAELDLPLPEEGSYVSELNLAARAWTAEWGQRLQQGALLLIDYGYPRNEYYLPSRGNGTLLCYYRHRAHSDPFFWPGLNDITAFVDFTSIAESAFENGLDVLGYTTQAQFLFNCGLLERLEQRGPRESEDYIRAARAAQRLTAPHEMGELFKVLALGKGIRQPLRGFMRGDRLHTL